MKNIWVVIATYNEADNIISLLDKLSDYNVIIVDDMSPDGTAEKILKQNGTNVWLIMRVGKHGIASAYLDGLEYALTYNPDYIIQMDAGLTHNPEDIKRFLHCAVTENYKLIIGSRFKDNKSIKNYRTIISLIAAQLMRFKGVIVTDATSGFRCWDAELLRKVLNKGCVSKGFSFQLETLYNAFDIVGNAGIYEVPIEYKLTNSSFRFEMLWEAAWTYFMILFS